MIPSKTTDQTRPQNGQAGADALGLAGQLQGKTPDEVLGSMNQASLAQGIVMATGVTVVLLAVLTVGPYLFGSAPAPKKPEKATAAATEKEAPAAEVKEAAADDSVTVGDAKVSSKTMKKLGVDDIKSGDRDLADDLLKDIK